MHDDLTTDLKQLGAKKIWCDRRYTLGLWYTRFVWCGQQHWLYGTSKADLEKRVAKWCEKKRNEVAA
jgi:hypothetical protein